MDSVVVSMTTASFATVSGDAARVLSRRSRSASAVATSGMARRHSRRVRGIGRAPSRALLGRRVQKEFHGRAGKYDRADVPPFHDDSPVAPSSR